MTLKMFISFEPIISLRIYFKKTIRDICKDIAPRLFILALFIMKD